MSFSWVGAWQASTVVEAPTIARIAGPCRCHATLYGLCTSGVRVGQAGKGTLFRAELAASYLGDAARPHSCKRRVCKTCLQA